MKIPYGVSDFHKIRSRDQLYVDRTDRIELVEVEGDALLFLRPRRFGKSLWLSTLATYYDLRYEGEHERLFGGLAVGKAPTPWAHRYFVMRWDFSKIDPDPPPWGVNAHVDSRIERIGNELRGYLNTTIEVFQRYYRTHLPEILELGEDPFHNFERLLSVIHETPYRLYLLIDEYDNFANEVLTDDEDVYRHLVKTDGPFKYLFKWVKGLMGGAGLDRLFITGVSPLVMSDVTSGMNIAESVFLYPELNTLCGFTEDEVSGLLEDLHAEKSDAGPSWTVRGIRDMMRDWYNGYRFAPDAAESVYNPTLVFYFAKHLRRTGAPPRQMLDANLAADEGKLDYIARLVAGEDTVIDLVRKGEPLQVLLVRDHFTLKELLEHAAQDTSFFGSYLYYFGMLTHEMETARQTLQLAVPNAVMYGLYVERIRRILMPLGTSRSAADAILFAFLGNGELEPLLDFVEESLFPTFSNRDARWANELTVKTIFLSLLWNARSYITHSEPEVDHLYADLCLLRRPDALASSLWDLLFEFKRVSLKTLKMTGKDVKALSREELMKLTQVKAALDDAEAQVVEYKAALARRRGDTLKLRSYAVVALGFERLVVRSVHST